MFLKLKENAMDPFVPEQWHFPALLALQVRTCKNPLGLFFACAYISAFDDGDLDDVHDGAS